MGSMDSTPFRFCPGCGREGLGLSEGKRLSCAACGFTLYLNVAAAAAAFITRGPQLLFAIRGRDPGKGLLDLPVV
jgi:NADH pyrophosphatase NudC (nudix superfamily)